MLSALLPQRRLHLRIMMKPRGVILNADIQKYDEAFKSRQVDEYNDYADANESITDKKPDELPDLNQIVLVYCRSGRRSKEASQKLADIGYTNVYEFGGINTWTGEIVK